MKIDLSNLFFYQSFEDWLDSLAAIKCCAEFGFAAREYQRRRKSSLIHRTRGLILRWRRKESTYEMVTYVGQLGDYYAISAIYRTSGELRPINFASVVLLELVELYE